MAEKVEAVEQMLLCEMVVSVVVDHLILVEHLVLQVVEVEQMVVDCYCLRPAPQPALHVHPPQQPQAHLFQPVGQIGQAPAPHFHDVHHHCQGQAPLHLHGQSRQARHHRQLPVDCNVLPSKLVI